MASFSLLYYCCSSLPRTTLSNYQKTYISLNEESAEMKTTEHILPSTQTTHTVCSVLGRPQTAAFAAAAVLAVETPQHHPHHHHHHHHSHRMPSKMTGEKGGKAATVANLSHSSYWEHNADKHIVHGSVHHCCCCYGRLVVTSANEKVTSEALP